LTAPQPHTPDRTLRLIQHQQQLHTTAMPMAKLVSICVAALLVQVAVADIRRTLNNKFWPNATVDIRTLTSGDCPSDCHTPEFIANGPANRTLPPCPDCKPLVVYGRTPDENFVVNRCTCGPSHPNFFTPSESSESSGQENENPERKLYFPVHYIQQDNYKPKVCFSTVPGVKLEMQCFSVVVFGIEQAENLVVNDCRCVDHTNRKVLFKELYALVADPRRTLNNQHWPNPTVDIRTLTSGDCPSDCHTAEFKSKWPVNRPLPPCPVCMSLVVFGETPGQNFVVNRCTCGPGVSFFATPEQEAEEPERKNTLAASFKPNRCQSALTCYSVVVFGMVPKENLAINDCSCTTLDGRLIHDLFTLKKN